MGIKLLNKFLIEKCMNHSIQKISFESLRGKIIAVDASIYIYKLLDQDASLLEIRIKQMIDIFIKNEITPYFIFDGKSPPEKKELIEHRKELKKKALETYNNYSDDLNNDQKNLLLKESFQIGGEHVKIVKKVLNFYKIPFYHSPMEADPLCVYMVETGKAWACLTEDMDVFVYGCHRVLRNMDLMEETFYFYETSKILEKLNISLSYFREILVLSGTDYNQKKTSQNNLYRLFQLFEQFRKTVWFEKKTSFYDWIIHQKHIKGILIDNMDKLRHCYSMFNTSYWNLSCLSF
jgi:5'-3' exonuclease